MFRVTVCLLLLLAVAEMAPAQDKVVIVPKSIAGAPFTVEDSTDLFAKSYRFFLEGEVELAADSLRKLIAMSNFQINPKAYYIVVANFTDRVSPIGLFHEGSGFLDTRLYGLKTDSLYYMFISRTPGAPSFISVMLKTKPTPFEANLPAFLQLIGFGVGLRETPQEKKTTWIDVRRFEIPDKFKRVSDISVVVKDSLKTDRYLASAVFDNTPLERWSYGIATAITTINDVVLEVGDDGTIVVKPKPNGDLAAFGVINFHFKAVDTKAPTLASSFHLLGGLRIAPALEPIIGLGFGVPVSSFELHLFGGGSLAFKNVLKEGFTIGQKVEEEVDPFKIEAKFYPRFGLEIKFP
jgi:hypothetical protein